MSRWSCAALLLVAAACSSSSNSGLQPQASVDRNPQLHQVSNCGQLEKAIEDAVVLQMKSTLEQIRKNDLWVGPGGGILTPTAAGPGPITASTNGPTNYTTTNVQVAGVDEADFVQNDGTRIAVLAENHLFLISSWPADAMAEASSLEIEGWPRELFLSGNQVVVFSSVYIPRALEGAHPICLAGTAPGGGAGVAAAAFCGYWASDITKVTTIDVTNLSSPQITSELYLPGSYQSARRIDQRVRLVISDTFPYPDGVTFWPNLPPGATDDQRNKAFDALEAQDEALIRGRSLDDWLRKGSVKRPGQPTAEVDYQCTDFAISTAPSRPGLLTIATVDLTQDTLTGRTSVLADPGTVYASQNTLYVASQHWWWWPAPGQSDATYIHAFDLTNPDRAGYLGSGVVDGTVNDQYAMDEFQNALRVATTLSTRVDDGTPWGHLSTSNRITVLGLMGGSLGMLGRTEDFGANERAFGIRFLGSRGFVITAQQIDPLFTFDLSDNTNPRKVAALQMPGFIAYLHPIDDTHLLGIGREQAPNSGPMQVKISLLDVSDLSNPKNIATQLVGQGFSWSEALWDPKAFTWLGANKTLAIPFADFAANDFVSDLRLFHVDPATGITPLGSLSMADVYLTYTGTNWSWSWSPYIRRAILADAFVYAISDAGVRSARVADLPAWLKTVQFPPFVFP
jgi:uncharacterized secreted protein with C-terminal beta-propeller domain